MRNLVEIFSGGIFLRVKIFLLNILPRNVRHELTKYSEKNIAINMEFVKGKLGVEQPSFLPTPSRSIPPLYTEAEHVYK